jgi:hypothetical protein
MYASDDDSFPLRRMLRCGERGGQVAVVCQRVKFRLKSGELRE